MRNLLKGASLLLLSSSMNHSSPFLKAKIVVVLCQAKEQTQKELFWRFGSFFLITTPLTIPKS
jgi:hypothetical protein